MDPDNADPQYRYQFEPLLTRIKGRNTGKRTILVNIVQIADDILGVKMDEQSHGSRYSADVITQTAKHIMAYIGKRLGGQSKYEKAGKVGVISGEKERHELQLLLFEYVAEYARCPYCKNEELTPAVLGNVQCKSCGNEQQSDSKKKAGKREKRKKQQKKKKKKHSTAEEHESELKVDDEDEAEEDANIRKQKQLEQRMRSDPDFAFKHFVTQNTEACSDDVMEKVKVLSLAHKLDRKQQIKMIVYGVLQYEQNDYKLLMQSIRKYRTVLEAFTLLKNDTHIFLAYMEEMIMHKAGGDALLHHAYHIFNCLYDEDIIGEDEVMEWYHSKHGQNPFTIIRGDEYQTIRNKTKPFVEWLENAENDESDEGD
eukprot:CAMPEP_0197051138 /NCGR_PEP_ID=MMETSP1384-20130603/25879_1 /TAXON_ID=29189 /ORGANISM="Ammonia sp." /LENGTH=368 /DNA_ID=CAMNT_0042483653 /DNA_START=154 /DNA_END=1260 /DNA_ORIENTATION=-